MKREHLGPPTRSTRRFSSEILGVTLSVVFFCLVGTIISIAVDPASFADFSVYVDISNELQSLELSELITFEPLSRGMIVGISNLVAEPTTAVEILHYLNAGIFVTGFFFLSLRYSNNWRGTLLVLALYGPLLAFVTLRATPAYLLTTYAFFISEQHPKKAILACLIATGFHVSAALALPPLLGAIQSNSSHQSTGGTPWKLDFFIVTSAVLLYLTMTGVTEQLGIVAAILEKQGALSKFAVYAAAAHEQRSIAHRIYFLIALGIVALLLRYREPTKSHDIRYITLSFLLYTFLTVSPVVAFRQSIFWMLPAILSLSIRKFTRTPISAYVFFIACCCLYVINIRSVLE